MIMDDQEATDAVSNIECINIPPESESSTFEYVAVLNFSDLDSFTSIKTGTGTRTRSDVWQFFTRDQQDRNQAICNICDRKYSTGGGTTNLRSHLQLKHKDHVLPRQSQSNDKCVSEFDSNVEINFNENLNPETESSVLVKDDNSKNDETLMISEYVVPKQKVKMEHECDIEEQPLLSVQKKSKVTKKSRPTTKRKRILCTSLSSSTRSKAESCVWRFFKRDSSDRSLAICNICGKKYSTGGGTSNLRSHLQFKHKNNHSLNVGRKVALITGISGQDGSYLAELLIDKGYTVHGIIRRASTLNTNRIEHLYSDHYAHAGGNMKLHYGDLTDSSSLVRIICKVKPTEIYNLGAQSHVKISFELNEYTSEVNALGTLRLLDAIRTSGLASTVKFYQASTSELYGQVLEVPQKETTPFYPRSPYAISKLYAYWMVNNYREAYNIFACNGILFNHESPRRGDNFVTRKITRSVAKIHLGFIDSFELGNLNSMRDWGHAKDYVEAMWLMLQQNEPDDYVIATNEAHSVRDFVEAAFTFVKRPIRWEGEGLKEVGVEQSTGQVRVKVSSKYFRPTEVDKLLGDPSKAKEKLGWQPKTLFSDLVADMMTADIKLMKEKPDA